MKERPILFSTPMIRALLNTKPGVWPAKPIDPSMPYKSMTRRVVKPQPDCDGVWNHTKFPLSVDSDLEGWWGTTDTGTDHHYSAPEKGDILWVRETWENHNDFYHYKADVARDLFDDIKNYKWRSPVFMPREAARITLEVKDVRVEKLHDISERDAQAEGAEKFPLKAGFYKIWEELNGKCGYPWQSNPWVWVYEFGRVERV
jgi:hypothetical protein